MARPQKHRKTGVYQFRKRVPDRLRALVRKGEEVRSLGTKDPDEARARWIKVAAEVEARWANLGTIKSLTHRETHALAGEIYRDLVASHDDEPGAPWAWRIRVNEQKRLEAKGSDDNYAQIRLAEEILPDMEDFLRDRGLVLDPHSVGRLYDAVRAAVLQANGLILKRALGDYRPDPDADRFPGLAPDKLNWEDVFSDYAEEAKLSAKTDRHWRNVVADFMARIGTNDLRDITKEQVLDYKAALLKGGMNASTVLNVRLAALKAVCGWAVQNHKLQVNPAQGVTVRLAKRPKERDRGFTLDEAEAILRASLEAPNSRLNSDQQAALRWVPWLCAYTGARVNEITGLHAENLEAKRVPDGSRVWMIHIRAENTKTLEYRDVAVHPHLLDQGFIAFVKSVGSGPLFYNPARMRTGSEVHPLHKKTGERLAKWVRRDVGITDTRIKPNHAWRHRFKSVCRDVPLKDEIRDMIQGHAPRTEGEKYGDLWPQVCLREISKLPKYLTDQSGAPSPVGGTVAG